MAVSLPKYACAVRTASLMNENLTAASLKYVDAVRFADLTKREMTASTPERANAVTCPLNAKFVELCPLGQGQIEKRNPEPIYLTPGISGPMGRDIPCLFCGRYHQKAGLEKLTI